MANAACVKTSQAVLIVPLKTKPRSLPLIMKKRRNSLKEISRRYRVRAAN